MGIEPSVGRGVRIWMSTICGWEGGRTGGRVRKREGKEGAKDEKGAIYILKGAGERKG